MSGSQFRVLVALIVACTIVIVISFFWTKAPSSSTETMAGPSPGATNNLDSQPAAIQQAIQIVDAAAIDAASDTSGSIPAGDATEGDITPPVSRTLDHTRLVVGIARDLEPFSFVDADGDAAGFEIELAQSLAQRWLADPASIELAPMAPSEAGSRLTNGDVDMVIASLARAYSSDSTLDFSQTYFLSRQGLLVPADSQVGSIQDLNGATIAVIAQTTQSAALIDEAQKNGVSVALVDYDGYGPAAEALALGEVDALAGDRFVLERIAANRNNLRMAATSYGEARFAIALAPGNSHLREMINFTIQDMKADGSYDALHRRWFPNMEPYAIEISGGFWPYSFASLPSTIDPTIDPNTDPNADPNADLNTLSTYQRIQDRGAIKVGISVNQPPFGLVDARGEISGFDPAVVRKLARYWLGDENAVEFVTGTIEEQVDRLAIGDIDLIAGVADERNWADLVDFSQPYIGPPATDRSMQLGLPQHDYAFRQLVDYTLQRMYQDGAYAELSTYWLGAGTPLYALETFPEEAQFLPLAYSASVEGLRSTVERIRARNNLLLAGVKYDFSPFGFLDDTGQVAGFDVDLTQALADSWGVDVQFVPVTSANRIQKLVDGEIDFVAASMTHTQGRDAEIDFSQTYFADGQALLVRRDAGIENVRDLNSLPVGAIEGSTSIIQIKDHAAANGVVVDIVPFQGYPLAVDALIAGEIAAVTTDSVALRQFARENPELDVVGELFTHEPYGFGLRAGDSTFASLVNYSLQSLKQSGTYDQLYRKWFGDDATPYAVEVVPGELSFSFSDAPAALDTPDEARIDRILAVGGFVAGVSQAREPFGYLDERGEPAGFEIDIAREFAKRWLGDPDAVKFIAADANIAADMLQSGEADLVIASLPHAQNLSEQINLSQTYFRGALGTDMAAEAAADNVPYAIGLPKYDDSFRDLVNFSLQEMRRDGTYDRLFRKWFDGAEPYAVEVWPGQSYLPVSLTPMVKVGAGGFVRGDSKGQADEQPEQTVVIDDFYIDQYEVTNRLYDLCVRGGSCDLPQRSFSLASGLYYADPLFGNYPVIWVTWDDALAYCAYVGKRLPTEAEWEKAARGSTGLLYPWGDDAPAIQANFNYIEGDLAEVGNYLLDASPYHVNDLAGNAREWIADWYRWDYYNETPEMNPVGPDGGTTRVVRGGAWDDEVLALRSSARRNLLPDSADANLGFRCASKTPPSR